MRPSRRRQSAGKTRLVGGFVGQEHGGAAQAEERVGHEHAAFVAKVPILRRTHAGTQETSGSGKSGCRARQARSARGTCVMFSVETTTAMELRYTCRRSLAKCTAITPALQPMPARL
jgi:hypothetical protein